MGSLLLLFARDLLALAARLRETDGDGLFAACHLLAAAAFQGAALLLVLALLTSFDADLE